MWAVKTDLYGALIRHAKTSNWRIISSVNRTKIASKRLLVAKTWRGRFYCLLLVTIVVYQSAVRQQQVVDLINNFMSSYEMFPIVYVSWIL